MNETIVYLKDQTFIPDFTRVLYDANGGCVVNFCNDESDATSYMLRCKRKFDSSDFTIESGQSVQMRFPATGRFEITNPCNGLMKVCFFLSLSAHNMIARFTLHYLLHTTFSLSRSQLIILDTCLSAAVYCRSN
jgi:hypothetical protein